MRCSNSVVARVLILALAGWFTASPAAAAEIRIAVASNFASTMAEIAGHFERQTGHRITLVSGSTGKHYAQIRNGAPFQLFFAADSERPQRLEAEGLAVPGSRFTYAIGRLVLWSPRADYVDPEGAVLDRGDFRHLALANPKLAPYGRAAREVLQKRGRWESMQDRLVRGENVGQAFQFVRSGNAELGFVAWAQLVMNGTTPDGSWWIVPEALHAPIEQQAVRLGDDAAARDFVAFVRTAGTQAIIRAHGYGTP